MVEIVAKKHDEENQHRIQVVPMYLASPKILLTLNSIDSFSNQNYSFDPDVYEIYKHFESFVEFVRLIDLEILYYMPFPMFEFVRRSSTRVMMDHELMFE